MEIITKAEYLLDLTKRIAEAATRKNRGCNDQEYLIRDLDAINKLAQIIEKVIASNIDSFRRKDISVFEMELMRYDIVNSPKI